MKLRGFLKDKIIQILLILFAFVTTLLFLNTTSIHIVLKIYVPAIILITYFLGLSIEFYQKRKFYCEMKEQLRSLSEKYLIAEVIEEPDFLEGKILKDTLIQTDKSMIEKVNEYKYRQEEYKEYIELWIHEIKIPIASSKLVIANNQNEITKSIEEELDKIEEYIEQALYYARSNTVEKDYCITQSNLKEIVNHVVKKNKNMLIGQKIKIELQEIDKIVYTDSKWTIFILNQIMSNCMKYSKEKEPEIIFSAEEQKDKVILLIRDNGIGMKEMELSRVFEKGFTGSNGRKGGKMATGIGLYLCKKLCSKLGLGIELTSKEGEGTTVKIIFPKSSYMLIK